MVSLRRVRSRRRWRALSSREVEATLYPRARVGVNTVVPAAGRTSKQTGVVVQDAPVGEPRERTL